MTLNKELRDFECAMHMFEGRALQNKRIASGKALYQEQTLYVHRTVRSGMIGAGGGPRMVVQMRSEE
jgi:septum formation inhibitor MinC